MILGSKFDLTTFTHSDTANKLKIDNTQITDEVFENLQRLHELLVHVHNRLSIKYARPVQIKINSAYRSKLLNEKIGGVATSQHCTGSASDTVAVGLSVQDYFNHIKELVKEKVITVDQAIQENHQWVHISIKKENNRNQFLQMQIIDGKKKYLPA